MDMFCHNCPSTELKFGFPLLSGLDSYLMSLVFCGLTCSCQGEFQVEDDFRVSIGPSATGVWRCVRTRRDS